MKQILFCEVQNVVMASEDNASGNGDDYDYEDDYYDDDDDDDDSVEQKSKCWK